VYKRIAVNTEHPLVIQPTETVSPNLLRFGLTVGDELKHQHTEIQYMVAFCRFSFNFQTWR